MENKYRVQDDLYNFVNHEWLENSVIPDDKPTTGGFSDLAKGVEELMISDFNKMSNNELACPDENVGKAIRLFNLAKDAKGRKKAGIKPVLKTLTKIDKLTDIKALNRNLKDFVIKGLPLPFIMSIEADMKDTNHYCVMLGGPSIFLPDTSYYKEEAKEQYDGMISLWKAMALKLMAKTKLSLDDQIKYVDDAVGFDKLIASLVKSQEEWSEYTKMYNPMKTSKVNSLLKPLKFKKLATELFGVAPENAIVIEPRYFKGFSTIFNDETFVLYKHWAYVKKLLDSSKQLSVEMSETSSEFSRALSGIKAAPSIEKQAYNLAASYFSEPVGLYYGRAYFGEEAKADVVSMVKEIIATYKKRMTTNDFLEEETKKKAIAKLDKIVIKMGYPEKADTFYDSLDFDDTDTLYSACEKMKEAKRIDEFSKLYKDVDRTRWVMAGHIVNACYDPFTNDITFPAAILQAPFYSIKQTRSQNLGGIGAVIAHEVSHAFDNNGAKCDEFGNLNNWWTKEDNKKFVNKTKAMIKEFDGIETEAGKVNGSFVVSENIADNGGMAVTLDIMRSMNDANYKEYFYNWARIWCQKAKLEYMKLLLAIDVHSPTMLRANMQPRNFSEWYETFDVKKTDKMYIDPKKRVVIW